MIRISLLFGLLLILSCSNQEQDFSQEENRPFYITHLGNWQGTLRILKNDSAVRQLGMTFNLAPIEDSLFYKRFKWQIQYEGQDKRDYLLLLDTVTHTYRIDEQNGIVLPAQLNNGSLSNWFTVMGNTLFVNFDFSNQEEIKFTVNMRSKQPVGFTGQSNQEIDSVTCYAVSSYQIGVLTKE